MSWEVTSLVTKENQNGFGPTTPMYLDLPWWYWASLVGGVAFILGLISVRLFFHMRWKKLVREMNSQDTALGATNQFYKDTRLLQNKYSLPESGQLTQDELIAHWEALESQFRLYLVRQFQVPAFKWSTGRILKHIKKKMSGAFSLRLEKNLKTVFSEFKKGLDSKQKLTKKDIQQMEHLCQNYIELIKKLSQGGKR